MLRKFFLWLPALAVSSALFAASETSQNPEELAVGPRFAARQTAQQQDKQQQQMMAGPCCRNVLCSARACPGNNGVFITADFLWWRADESDLPFALIGTNDSVSVPSGRIDNMKFKWKPGFRVGIGGDLDYDGWDLYLNWTWYRNSSSTSDSTPVLTTGTNPVETGVFLPFLLSLSNGGNLDGAVSGQNVSAKWRLLFNMIDLELGRDFYVSENLAIRPFIGARGGWINRRFTISLTDPVTPVTSALPEFYSAKANVWGVGPRGGFNSAFKFGCARNWMIFGDLAASILYGKVFKDWEELDTSGPGSDSLIFSRMTATKHHWRAIPNLQLFLGLGWGDCFNCNKMYFGVRLGWEANFYWNLPAFITPNTFFASLQSAHSLALDGLTLDFKLDF